MMGQQTHRGRWGDGADTPMEACRSEPAFYSDGPAIRGERSLREVSHRAAMGIEALRDPVTRRLKKHHPATGLSQRRPLSRHSTGKALEEYASPTPRPARKLSASNQRQTQTERTTYAAQHIQPRVTSAPLLAVMWHHRVGEMDLAAPLRGWRGDDDGDSGVWQILYEDNAGPSPVKLEHEFTEADLHINYNPLEAEASLVSESSLSDVSKQVYWNALRPELAVAPPTALQERAAAVVRNVEERLSRGHRLCPSLAEKVVTDWEPAPALTRGSSAGRVEGSLKSDDRFSMSRLRLIDLAHKDNQASRQMDHSKGQGRTSIDKASSPAEIGPDTLLQDVSERVKHRQAVLDLWARSPRRSSQLLAPWSPRSNIHKASMEATSASGRNLAAAKAVKLLRVRSTPKSSQGTLPEIEEEFQAGEDNQYSGSYGSLRRRAASSRKMYEAVSRFNADAYQEENAAHCENGIRSNARRTATAVQQASLNPGNFSARRQWARALEDLRSQRPHFKAPSPRDLRERQTRSDHEKASPRQPQVAAMS